MTRSFVPLLLTVALAFPALGQLPPGTERLAGPPGFSAVPGTVVASAAAGGQVGVVWQRALRSSNRLVSYWSIFDPDGTSPRSVALLPVDGAPQVAALGSNFRIAWISGSTLFTGSLHGSGLSEVASVATVSEGEQVQHLVSNGSQLLLVIADNNREWMRAVVLGSDGRPDSPWIEGPAISTAAGADPAGFLLLNTEWISTPGMHQEIHGRRVTSGGIANEFFTATGDQGIGSLFTAFDGVQYIVGLYNDYWAGTPKGTRAFLVSPDGSSRSEIFTIDDESAGRLVAIVARPGASMFFLNGPDVSRYVRIDHSTRTMEATATVAPPLKTVVPSGERTLMLYDRWQAGGELYAEGRWLSFTGELGVERLLISTGTREQLHPAVARGRSVDLIVWEEIDDVAGVHLIRAARVLPTGRVLDSSSLLVSRPFVPAFEPAVTFDGRNFVIVWCEGTQFGSEGRLVSRRLDENGTPLDAQPMVISGTRADTPAVAFTNGVALVVWCARDAAGYRKVLGARLSDGSLIDAVPLTISRDIHEDLSPDVAANTDRFLVGWQTWFWPGYHAPIATGSSVAIVSTIGSVSEPIVLTPLADNANVSGPQLAWNGSIFLAAWSGIDRSFAREMTAAGEPGRLARVPLRSVSDVAFVQNIWDVASASGGDVYLSGNLTSRWVRPDDGALDSKIASDGSRSIVVYRREIIEPPYDGSSTILYRIDDDPSLCCTTSLKQRAIRH